MQNRDNTMKKVLVVIPSIARMVCLTVVANARKTLKHHGYLPVFYLGIHGQFLNADFQKTAAKQKEIHVVKYTGASGEGAGILTAIKQGTAHEHPDLVLIITDDFELESKHLHKIAKAAEKSDLSIGIWDKYTEKTFPLPQALNEKATVSILTYSNPQYKPKTLKPIKTLKLPNKNAYQTYSTLYGFSPATWKKINRELNSFKQSKSALMQAGIEVGIVLSALKLNLRIKQVTMPRRFEHSTPCTAQEQKNHRKSRATQFNDGLQVALEFLTNTGQKNKVPNVKKYAGKMKQKILTSRILAKGQKPRRSKTESAMHLK